MLTLRLYFSWKQLNPFPGIDIKRAGSADRAAKYTLITNIKGISERQKMISAQGEQHRIQKTWVLLACKHL